MTTKQGDLCFRGLIVFFLLFFQMFEFWVPKALGYPKKMKPCYHDSIGLDHTVYLYNVDMEKNNNNAQILPLIEDLGLVLPDRGTKLEMKDRECSDQFECVCVMYVNRTWNLCNLFPNSAGENFVRKYFPDKVNEVEEVLREFRDPDSVIERYVREIKLVGGKGRSFSLWIMALDYDGELWTHTQNPMWKLPFLYIDSHNRECLFSNDFDRVKVLHILNNHPSSPFLNEVSDVIGLLNECEKPIDLYLVSEGIGRLERIEEDFCWYGYSFQPLGTDAEREKLEEQENQFREEIKEEEVLLQKNKKEYERLKAEFGSILQEAKKSNESLVNLFLNEKKLTRLLEQTEGLLEKVRKSHQFFEQQQSRLQTQNKGLSKEKEKLKLVAREHLSVTVQIKEEIQMELAEHRKFLEESNESLQQELAVLKERQKDIEQLAQDRKARIGNLEEKNKILEGEVGRLRDFEKMSVEKERLLQENERLVAELTNKKDSLQRTLTDLQAEQRRQRKLANEQKTKVDDLEEEKKTLEGRVDEFEGLKEKIAEQESNIKEHERLFVKEKARRESLEQELDSLQGQKNTIESEKEELKHRVDKLEKDLTEQKQLKEEAEMKLAQESLHRSGIEKRVMELEQGQLLEEKGFNKELATQLTENKSGDEVGICLGSGSISGEKTVANSKTVIGSSGDSVDGDWLKTTSSIETDRHFQSSSDSTISDSETVDEQEYTGFCARNTQFVSPSVSRGGSLKVHVGTLKRSASAESVVSLAFDSDSGFMDSKPVIQKSTIDALSLEAKLGAQLKPKRLDASEDKMLTLVNGILFDDNSLDQNRRLLLEGFVKDYVDNRFPWIEKEATKKSKFKKDKLKQVDLVLLTAVEMCEADNCPLANLMIAFEAYLERLGLKVGRGVLDGYFDLEEKENQYRGLVGDEKVDMRQKFCMALNIFPRSSAWIQTRFDELQRKSTLHEEQRKQMESLGKRLDFLGRLRSGAVLANKFSMFQEFVVLDDLLEKHRKEIGDKMLSFLQKKEITFPDSLEQGVVVGFYIDFVRKRVMGLISNQMTEFDNKQEETYCRFLDDFGKHHVVEYADEKNVLKEEVEYVQDLNNRWLAYKENPEHTGMSDDKKCMKKFIEDERVLWYEDKSKIVALLTLDHLRKMEGVVAGWVEKLTHITMDGNSTWKMHMAGAEVSKIPEKVIYHLVREVAKNKQLVKK